MTSMVPPGMKVAVNWPFAIVLLGAMATVVALAWLRIINTEFLTHALALFGGTLLPVNVFGLVRNSSAMTRRGDYPTTQDIVGDVTPSSKDKGAP